MSIKRVRMRIPGGNKEVFYRWKAYCDECAVMIHLCNNWQDMLLMVEVHQRAREWVIQNG
jgi:hypothetical protein